MWLIILFIFLLANIIVFYKVNNKDILSASFISGVSYEIAVFVALLNYNYWGVTYSYKLPLMIMTCIYSIFVGEKLCGYVVKKKHWDCAVETETKPTFEPSNKILAILFGLGILTCIFQYINTVHIANMYGYNGNGHMLEYVRNAYLFQKVPKVYTLVILSYFQAGVAYVCTLKIIKNIVDGNTASHKINLKRVILQNHKYLLMVIPYFILLILSTARIGFLSYIIITFLMIIIFYQRKKRTNNVNIWKFAKIGLICVIAFLLIFWLLGYLTGKSQNNSIINVFSKYIGSSIPGLNENLVNKDRNPDYQTFYGVKTFLNRFGADLPIPQNVYGNDTYFPKNSGTNIYTSNWIYYNDFSWFGVIFFNIELGFFVSLLQNFARRKKEIWVILSGYYGYYLVSQLFGELFISYILTTTRILDLFSIVCCYYLLYKPFWKVGSQKISENEADKLKVLFLQEYDYWDVIRSKLEKTEGFVIAETFSKNKLWYYHNSIRLNSYINLPFKNIWYNEYFSVSKPENVELILFFEYVSPAYDKKYLSYLRKKYPNAKLVFFIINPINHENKRYLESILPLYDKVITFDEGEAEKNGFLHFNGLYERDDTIKGSGSKSDVFFVGRGKDRLDTIHEIYKHLTAHNIKCDFYVNNVEKEKQLKGTDIHYNCWLNYKQVQQHVVDTKCVLEILQGEQNGFTMRTCEAITYRKRLITNNKALKEQPFYNPRFMQIIESASDIKADFINDAAEVDISGADFSVERFINFLNTI